MDSLTQIVLGAAVGEILLGRTLGNKALLLGAIGGTVPDLDVLYEFINNDPIKTLEVHRGYSHSVLTHVFLALPFAWISNQWSKQDISFKKWYIFWFLCFFTHALLDCCTTYGTKLFTPLTNYQVAFNNISVIDPLYTIPFLILLSATMFFKKGSVVRRKILFSALIISSFYLLLTFGLKYSVHKKFESNLIEKGIIYNRLSTTPTLLNSVLWSAIATSDSMLYIAEYSYLNNEVPIEWIQYKRNLNALSEFDSKQVDVLKWFSEESYFVKANSSDSITFYSVKFGRLKFDSSDPDKAFVFSYKVFKEDNEVKCVEIRPDNLTFLDSFKGLIERVGI